MLTFCYIWTFTRRHQNAVLHYGLTLRMTSRARKVHASYLLEYLSSHVLWFGRIA